MQGVQGIAGIVSITLAPISPRPPPSLMPSVPTLPYLTLFLTHPSTVIKQWQCRVNPSSLLFTTCQFAPPTLCAIQLDEQHLCPPTYNRTTARKQILTPPPPLIPPTFDVLHR